jgi:hypothetical protein
MTAFALIAEIGGMCLSLGCQSVPRTFGDDPEFGRYVREAKGRYLGCLGNSLAIPGVSGPSDYYSNKEVYVVPGPGDFWRSEEDRRYVEQAWKFAEKYNLWLLSTKKPKPDPVANAPGGSP